MEKTFVKQVGIEKSYRDGGDGQEKTVHLMMPCKQTDRGAIQFSPTNCIAHELWGNSSNLWHIHRYRIVKEAPAQFKTVVPWGAKPITA
jgi:hypothetical protein